MPPKSFNVIEVFFSIIKSLYDSGDEGLTINGICDVINMTPSQANPLLERLEENDWVQKDVGTGIYRIGMHMLYFADSERLNIELVRQLAPVLSQLSERCGQTVEMNVIESVNAVCIYKVEQNNAIRIASRIGRQSPLHAGASSKILLAYASETLQKQVLTSPMIKFTPNTITDVSLMLNEFDKIKKLGYAESIEELDHGAAAVAVPILNGRNGILAEISIIGTKFSYNEQRDFWINELLKTKSLIHIDCCFNKVKF